MSRRREAQDLERALALSTQEEAQQSPSTSSSRTPARPGRAKASRPTSTQRATSTSVTGEDECQGRPASAETETSEALVTSKPAKRQKSSSVTDKAPANDPQDPPESVSPPPAADQERESSQRPSEAPGTHIPARVVPSSRSPSPTKLDATSARKRLFGKRTSFSAHSAITSLLPSSPSHVPGLRRGVRLPPLHTNRRSPPPPKPRLPTKETKKAPVGSGSEDEGEPEPDIDYENEGFL